MPFGGHTIARSIGFDFAADLDYTHRPLIEQLERFGIRQFEIDVFADPEGGLYADRAALPVVGLPAESGEPLLDEPGFKVLHTQDFDLIVIAIKKASGEMLFNPHFETLIEPQDTVIVMGKSKDLRSFAKAINPKDNP